MALAHSGGPLIVLFLPAFLVILVMGSGGPLGGTPEWLFLSVAAAAQFAGYLAAIHLIRLLWRARDENEG
jgi:hypothetical protein